MKHANPNQIVNNLKAGRNQLCPCGSKIKFKHCCNNPIRYHNKQLLAWLKANDSKPPTDYDNFTIQELDDPHTTHLLLERIEEVKNPPKKDSQTSPSLASSPAIAAATALAMGANIL